MSKFVDLIEDYTEKVMDSFKFDEDGNLVGQIDEQAKQASKIFRKAILEKTAGIWDNLEAAEGSLQNAADEISFEELNADPSSLDTDIVMADQEVGAMDDTVAMDDPATDVGGMNDFGTGDLGGGMDQASGAFGESVSSLTSMLDSEDPDFESIFSEDYNDMEFDEMKMREMEGEDEYEDDPEMKDGDEEFSDMQIGVDDDDMGEKDSYDPDTDADSIGGDEEDGFSAMDGDDGSFDFDLGMGGEEDEVGEMSMRYEDAGEDDFDDMESDPEMSMDNEDGIPMNDDELPMNDDELPMNDDELPMNDDELPMNDDELSMDDEEMNGDEMDGDPEMSMRHGDDDYEDEDDEDKMREMLHMESAKPVARRGPGRPKGSKNKKK